MNHATWLQLEEEQAVPAWRLCHPMGLPDASPQGHMPLTLPVPGKGARDPQGCMWGSTCLATVDCRDVWGSRGKAMQGRPKLSLTYLGLMKPKGVVSKILPFSEIFLSDVFNSTWSG